MGKKANLFSIYVCVYTHSFSPPNRIQNDLVICNEDIYLPLALAYLPWLTVDIAYWYI